MRLVLLPGAYPSSLVVATTAGPLVKQIYSSVGGIESCVCIRFLSGSGEACVGSEVGVEFFRCTLRTHPMPHSSFPPSTVLLPFPVWILYKTMFFVDYLRYTQRENRRVSSAFEFTQ
ncbi:hypothetical protein BDY19DRAFT_450686 [Irpex rosettiformis]|uniref:Uncharacterized protein n=1 Tax=Irpex rosettiformis TaxID=378272 RepID=A0ACB8TTH1_9APHY|nr:hypothetical protein BDY19DRAFT_450686 [Irpex rosettiformis]